MGTGTVCTDMSRFGRVVLSILAICLAWAVVGGSGLRHPALAVWVVIILAVVAVLIGVLRLIWRRSQRAG